MKHWYTNGLPGSENNLKLDPEIEEIPKDFYLGRTFNKEFGLKISNTRNSFSDEKWQEINTKKQATEKQNWDSLSDEDKQQKTFERSLRSKLAYLNMSDEAKKQHAEKSSQPHIGTHQSEDTKNKIRKSRIGKPLSNKHKQDISSTLRLKYASGELEVWNKGKTGLQHWTLETYEKCYNTKTINKTHNTSKPEEDMYADLCLQYGEENIIRNYRDSRYANPENGVPFNCDFYVIPEDRFIELNRFWTHGTHPFDPYNLDDLCTLEDMQYKAEHGRPKYKLAIDVWTVRDPLKVKVAKENNLNIDIIY